jgi:hypothetical protein
MPALGILQILTLKKFRSTGEPWNSVEDKPEAVKTLSALCIRNMADLHNNHSDRACGRVIEMDLRTASEPLRVHVTGDLRKYLTCHYHTAS